MALWHLNIDIASASAWWRSNNSRSNARVAGDMLNARGSRASVFATSKNMLSAHGA